MVSNTRVFARREIAEVRVRVNWRGKFILQVRNRIVEVPVFGEELNSGFSAWRDASGFRAEELFQVMRFLQIKEPNHA